MDFIILPDDCKLSMAAQTNGRLVVGAHLNMRATRHPILANDRPDPASSSGQAFGRSVGFAPGSAPGDEPMVRLLLRRSVQFRCDGRGDQAAAVKRRT